MKNQRPAGSDFFHCDGFLRTDGHAGFAAQAILRVGDRGGLFVHGENIRRTDIHTFTALFAFVFTDSW